MQGELAAVLPIPGAHPVPKGLVTKLLEAIQEVQIPIPKRGLNEFSNYNYATAEDIIGTVRLILARHGLLVYTSTVERTSEAIKTSQGKDAWREAINMRFTVTDGEGEISFDVPGEGQDTGDKAIYKAITGALKYGFRLLLHLPFGDDPEAESNETRRGRKAQETAQPRPHPAAQGPRPAPPPSPRPAPTLLQLPAQASAQPGGKATDKQVAALKALAKALGATEEVLLRELKSRYSATLETITSAQAHEFIELMRAEERSLKGSK